MSKRCESCMYWNQGDRRCGDRKVGNSGLCTWMTEFETLGLHTTKFRVPFWAKGIMRHTLSFDGEGCEVWTSRDKSTQEEKNS